MRDDSKDDADDLRIDAHVFLRAVDLSSTADLTKLQSDLSPRHLKFVVEGSLIYLSLSAIPD